MCEILTYLNKLDDKAEMDLEIFDFTECSKC